MRAESSPEFSRSPCNASHPIRILPQLFPHQSTTLVLAPTSAELLFRVVAPPIFQPAPARLLRAIPSFVIHVNTNWRRRIESCLPLLLQILRDKHRMLQRTPI